MSNEWFNRALRAHQQGELQVAAKCYLKYLAINPKDPNALQLYGVVMHALGDDETAQKYMQASIQIKPDQPQVMLNLASCQRKLKEYDAALKTVSVLIRQDPANFNAFRSRMFILVEKGDYPLAFKELANQLHKFPGHFELYNLLGAVASECKQYEKAISAYSKAVKIRPNSDIARHNLGLAYRHIGNPKLALQEYYVVLNSGKHSYQLMHNLGNAYNDLGHLQKAITYYKSALKLNNQHIETHVRLVELLWKMNEPKQLFNSLIKAIQKHPENNDLVFVYGDLLIRAGELDECQQLLTKKAEKLSLLPQFQLLSARLQIKKQEPEAAKQVLSKSLENKLRDNHLKTEIAMLLTELGVYDLAIKVLQEVVREKANNLALGYLGLCWMANNRVESKKLNQYPALVKTYRVLDFAQDRELWKMLLDKLQTLHAESVQTMDSPIHEGSYTRGSIFSLKDEGLEVLADRFKSAMSNYANDIVGVSNDWLNLDKQATFCFERSASAMIKNGGYIRPQLPQSGDLSVVLVVKSANKKVPKTRFHFGKPPESFHGDFNVAHSIDIGVGELMVFPSYMWFCSEKNDAAGNVVIISADMLAQGK